MKKLIAITVLAFCSAAAHADVMSDAATANQLRDSIYDDTKIVRVDVAQCQYVKGLTSKQMVEYLKQVRRDARPNSPYRVMVTRVIEHRMMECFFNIETN